MPVDDDDKPTVVLDLNALKKMKQQEEEQLANLAQELEFNVDVEADAAPKVEPSKPEVKVPAQVKPVAPAPAPAAQTVKDFPVILFDFNSDAFESNKAQFPEGYKYQVVKTLPELNKILSAKSFQIIVFNYDVNPKAVNSLTAQIKQKFPHTKTLIMAKAISPEKAKIHAATASGANGYAQFPVDAKKIEAEFVKIRNSVKKVG